MLKFIGSGSAFNTKLGNNSAYYKEGNQMLLIDCGSNIFQRIKENSLLEGVEHIHVLITHTHADHVGSLADLILYTYYSHGEFAKPKVTVYSPSSNEDFDLTGICKLLNVNGCSEGIHFNINYIRVYDHVKIGSFESLYITPFETIHVNEINSFGYDLHLFDEVIYYSGDTNSVDTEDYMYFKEGGYDYFYIDTCKADYEGNVHLSLRKLTKLIPEEFRHRVYCMHLDEGFDREEAEKLGFNVVKNEF